MADVLPIYLSSCVDGKTTLTQALDVIQNKWRVELQRKQSSFDDILMRLDTHRNLELCARNMLQLEQPRHGVSCCSDDNVDSLDPLVDPLVDKHLDIAVFPFVPVPGLFLLQPRPQPQPRPQALSLFQPPSSLHSLHSPPSPSYLLKDTIANLASLFHDEINKLVYDITPPSEFLKAFSYMFTLVKRVQLEQREREQRGL